MPKEGDLFVLSPKKGYYFLGKVMESNIESSNSLMSGSHVVVIFSTCFNTMDIEIFKPNYHELLTDPFIVSNQYWEKGYFYVIKHSPLSEAEKKLEIGFYKIHPLGNSFCTSSGERLEHEPQILGMYGLCTITGVAAEINRSLIMNPSIIPNFLLKNDNLSTKSIDSFIKNDEGIITIDIGDKLVREISNYIEVHFGVYINGYNWEKFLDSYFHKNKMKKFEDLEMNTDAGTIELHFLDGDFVMNKDLYDQIVYLFMNPQIIYSFISKYNNEIMWE